MYEDESGKLESPLILLAEQDLDPLSHDELAARIVALEGEIARTRLHMERGQAHRAAADGLFR